MVAPGELPASVVEAFGLTTLAISPMPDAMLSPVFAAGDSILRGRPSSAGAEASLLAETALLDETRELVAVDVPDYLPTTAGTRFCTAGGLLWTLHRRLPGATAGNWFALHESSDDVDRAVLRALRAIHDDTAGRLPERFNAPYRLLELTDGLRNRFADALGAIASNRIGDAERAIERFARNVGPENAVFVHGDYHHGNVLLDRSRLVTGIIDLELCRAGTRLDDLGFTAAMMLRDYQHWNSEPSPARLTRIADLYGLEPEHRSTLTEYTLLYALYDCAVFEPPVPNADQLKNYQLRFCGALSRMLMS